MEKKRFVSLFLIVLLFVNTAFAEDGKIQEGHTRQSKDYRVVVHWVESNGNQLYGEFYIPESLDLNERNPVVILAPGFSSNTKGISYYTSQLAANGWLCYAFDFAGGSLTGRSDGDMLDMSILTEVADLENVLSDLSGQDFVDPDRVVLMGFSQGGAVSALTAGKNPDLICGEVLMYPGFSIAEHYHEVYQTIENVPDDGLEFLNTAVGRQYITDIWNLDLLAEASRYPKPVLIVHATGDDIVPYAYSVQAASAFLSAELITVESMGHTFGIAVIDELLPDILAYMANAVR